MKHTPIRQIPGPLPPAFAALVRDAQIFDSSSSPEARVYYIQKDGGYYLKSAAAGTLASEVRMTRYFSGKGLASQVLAYETGPQDWLLTPAIPGHDCTHTMYLSQPERLCDTLAQLLRQLHSIPAEDCPVCIGPGLIPDPQAPYNTDLFPDASPFLTREAAWEAVQALLPQLRCDVLTHGDYCLPNVMLDTWRFSGFLDVGGGGLGDRHLDLFWGIWSLGYNLKTNRYATRFLDAYGRDAVCIETLRAVAALECFR